MEATTDRNQWWQDAACLGTQDDLRWVWSSAPRQEAVDACLSICASCPVISECHAETSLTHPAHPWQYQVRSGLCLWLDEDVAQLHEPIPNERCETCRRAGISPAACHHGKRRPGRPTGLIKSTHLQDNYPLTGPDVNRDEYPRHEYPDPRPRNHDGSNHRPTQQGGR